jgi:hypothetical protein
MITNVSYKPARIGTPYNPIVWSVVSDQTGQRDFQYVIDVYVNGTKVTRLRQRPNPAGYGMWDVSSIVQPYLKISNFTQGELEAPNTAVGTFSSNEEASVQVYCKVGEQYGPSQTVYNGVATGVVGDPAYTVYSAYAVKNLAVTVVAGSLMDHASLWNMQNPATNGVWYDDVFNGNIKYEWRAGRSNPLSRQKGYTRRLYAFDAATLSYINFSASSSGSDCIYGFRFTWTPLGGSEYAIDYPMITANGFGQRALCTSALTQNPPLPQYDIVNINTSPAHIKAITGWNMQPGDSYSFTGYSKKTGGTCEFQTPLTKTITYTIDEYCQLLYPRVRLSWLNELAGRDYFNFTMLAEPTNDASYESYGQNQVNWSAYLPVPQLNSTYPPFKTLPIQGGDKVYNKTVTTKWTVQTDWLTQDQVDLLLGCQKSPQILAYIHDPANAISDAFPYSVTIADKSFTTKLVKQNKLTTVTFTLEVNMPQALQNT